MFEKRWLKRSGAALLSACALGMLAGCPRPNNNSNQVSTNPTTAPGAAFTQTKVVYLPGDDEKLHPKKVSFKSLESQTRAGGNAAPALQEIIQNAPAYFPPKTKINSSQETEKHIAVDLNTNFADQDFWGVKGEMTTQLALYSIINSASGETKKPVLLTVEGKPMPNIGEYDVGEPLPPEPALMAPASSTKAASSTKPAKPDPSEKRVEADSPLGASSTKSNSSTNASSTKAATGTAR